MRVNYTIGQDDWFREKQRNMWLNEYKDKLMNNQNQYNVIYGAGTVAKVILQICKELGIKIDCFCVSDLRGNVSDIDNIPVICFFNLPFEINDTCIFIGAVERNFEGVILENIKKAHYERYVECPRRLLELDAWEYEKRSRPILEITPVVGCSVNCKYCPQNTFIKNYCEGDRNRERELSLEMFKHCIDKLPKNALIRFAGFAEPFLNSRILDMFEYANRNGYDMSLYTTLVGLKENQIRRLIEIPFKEVVLHTPDKDGFANIPITQEYMNCLEFLVNAKKCNGDQFIDKANCQSTPDENILRITRNKIKISIDLQDRAGNLDDKRFQKSCKNGKLKCELAINLNHNVLLPDGTVVLCCNDFGLKHKLGNLFNQEYYEIINGNELNRIKKVMRDELKGSILCHNCAMAVSSK